MIPPPCFLGDLTPSLTLSAPDSPTSPFLVDRQHYHAKISRTFVLGKKKRCIFGSTLPPIHCPALLPAAPSFWFLPRSLGSSIVFHVGCLLTPAASPSLWLQASPGSDAPPASFSWVAGVHPGGPEHRHRASDRHLGRGPASVHPNFLLTRLPSPLLLHPSKWTLHSTRSQA